MGLCIDIHVHTARHSPCSTIDAERLIGQAVRAGLDGLVITEHHYQWPEEELDVLQKSSGAPGFLLMAGFEYTTRQGDLLVYGLDANACNEIETWLRPEEAVAWVHREGGFCIAAHPTRAGMGFDESILELKVDAIEVCSGNLEAHEQRLAQMIANKAGTPAIAASDAHRLGDVGRYALSFEHPVRGMADLRECIQHGRFQRVGEQVRRARTL